MNTATMIANLIATFTDLKVYFEGARDSIEARVNAILGDLLNTLELEIFVDETRTISGVGTAADPVNRIDSAFSMARHGQLLSIRLLSDAQMRRGTKLLGRATILIAGSDAAANSVLRKLTFASVAENEPQDTPSIYGRQGLDLRLDTLAIELGGKGAGVTFEPACFGAGGIGGLHMRNTSVSGTGSGTHLISQLNPWAVSATGLSSTNMGGRWIANAAAGVSITADTHNVLGGNRLPNA